jgi:hypothetical protein
MLIELLTGIVGRYGNRGPGDILEMDDADAARMVASGQAVAVVVEREPETAAIFTEPFKGRKHDRVQNAVRRARSSGDRG